MKTTLSLVREIGGILPLVTIKTALFVWPPLPRRKK